MLRGPNDERTEKKWQTVHAQVMRLELLARNLLDVTKIGRGEITFEPRVKEDPGRKHANKERRDPRMQPQDPREDDERRSSAPPLYTHRTARLSVERRSGGPTTATSLTAASARISSHDGSNSTRRTLNFGARGSAW